MTGVIDWKFAESGVVEARATIAQIGDGWSGLLHGQSAGQAIVADKVSEVRTHLAMQVWQRVQETDMQVALSQVERVRLYSSVITRHERGGKHTGGEVAVAAAGDRGEQQWTLTTLGGGLCATPHEREAELLMGLLGASVTPPFRASGESFEEAHLSLAQAILMDLSFQGDEVVSDWSALVLTVITRKTVSVASLGI